MSLATTVQNSVGIGASVMTGALKAVRSIGIGSNILNNVTTGESNYGIGNNILPNITTGSSNLGIGKNIFGAFTEQQSNFGIGIRIADGADDLNGTFSYGIDIMNNVSYASNSFFFGSYLVYGSGTIITDSAFIGSQMFQGSDNYISQVVAVGVGSGSATSTGTIINGVFLGTLSATNIVNSTDDVYIGTLAGYSAVSTSGNAVIGSNTGYGLINGTNNVIIGSVAAFSNDTNASVLVGAFTANAWTGDNLTIVGYNALASGSGSNIVAVGFGALSNTAGLTRTMALGYEAGAGGGGSHALTDVILLGYKTEPSTSSATNEFCLGSSDSVINTLWLGQGGLAASTAANIALKPTETTGTNKAGANFDIYAGRGTGNAGSGSVRFYTGLAGSSGTTQNTERLSGQFLNTGVFETKYGRQIAVRVVTASGAVTVTSDDETIVINKTTPAATTVNLPAGITGALYTIKDGAGNAATYNITITPASGNIDGAGTFVMNNNYESITVVYNGTQWNII
jgi:hypothetical protein